MKKAGAYMAPLAAASASLALPSHASDHHKSSSSTSPPVVATKEADRRGRREAKKEKYVPRFDGLRFIETLVTGHRFLSLLINLILMSDLGMIEWNPLKKTIALQQPD